MVGATLIQTLDPTTTLARYIDADDGHVYDLPLDVPGAIPQVVSDTTIPGGVDAIWVDDGNAVVMQYLDTSDAVKTLYMNFQVTTSSSSSLEATKILFLPNNIIGIAASPDGKDVVYLLQTASGSDGYTAKADGTGAKKLFSLPLSQMIISWPSKGTLLAYTKSAAGVPGIVFAIDVKSGNVTPLVYADGITATADPTFANVIYQVVLSDGSAPITYIHNVSTGLNQAADFNPAPERCIWSEIVTSFMYCAISTVDTQSNFLDLWHQGETGGGDAIFSFDVSKNTDNLVAALSNSMGSSDISEMALSPDEHYLDFVTKGDRTLWGVRLTQP